MKTRTEIILEVDRVIIVNRKKRTLWCDNCSRQVEMLNIDDAAIFAQVNSRTIFAGPNPEWCTRVKHPKDYCSSAPIPPN
jgi:hypothetical protein